MTIQILQTIIVLVVVEVLVRLENLVKDHRIDLEEVVMEHLIHGVHQLVEHQDLAQEDGLVVEEVVELTPLEV